MTRERNLADKVLFSIHNCNEEEVEKHYQTYIDYTELLGTKTNNDILIEISLSYNDYILKKIKEMKKI